MADITMCVNKLCPNASHCYRVTAVPDRFAQSMALFEYTKIDKKVVCDNYIDKGKIKYGMEFDDEINLIIKHIDNLADNH
jgi:hypothetical protein